MIKHFKQTVKIVFENSVLVSVFVIITVLIELCAVALLTKFFASNFWLGFAAANTILLATALFSGWLNMCKSAICSNKEINQNIIKDFFAGVSQYFFKNFLIIIAACLTFTALGLLGIKIFNVIYPELHYSANDFTEFFEIIKNSQIITPEILDEKFTILLFSIALAQIAAWAFNLIVLFFIAGNYFCTTQKNFSTTTKFLFTNIWQIFKLGLSLAGIYLITSFLMILLSANFFTSIFSIFVFGFYISFYAITVFRFYEEKTKDLCNSRCDS